ncbi:hypothetical protein C8Q74DRAFT_406220 [Fomes fomentarius]|nr:hypothetical protein C8Q74DRAFT_406220 [Fomes fomentarius]
MTGTSATSANMGGLSSNIEESTWMKVQVYARRVRRLEVRLGMVEVDPSVWSAVTRKLDGEPVFPLLQYLRAEVCLTDPAPSFLALSLSPSLQILRIRVPNSPSTFEFCSEAMGLIAVSSPPELRSHIQSLGALSQLHTLDLKGALSLGVSNLPALGGMLRLRTLVVGARCLLGRPVSFPGAFPSLECLTVAAIPSPSILRSTPCLHRDSAS